MEAAANTKRTKLNKKMKKEPNKKQAN